MPLTFDECKSIAQDLKNADSTRDGVFTDSVNAYMLKDENLPDGSWIKETFSADIRDAVNGAARLISAGEPKFSVPYETNADDAQKLSSQVERICSSIHNGMIRAKGRSYIYEAVKSALIYDEVHIAVNLIKDLTEAAQPEDKPRYEEVGKYTPGLFSVISPSICFPFYDAAGLKYHYSEMKKRAGEVKTIWGKDAVNVLGD